ncbi:OLC1v1021573C1 [Oldenlandia corymbosa var. corymbosa]|uniref:OLC1v1021573C1 n=1 Tax=Oldenlandia corymbosa var. corymbosa TaxID=529605 RepID=A0AAV1BY88_OLDCO|nr:OLC1v1021573C1 [Oldenlandia corymbosa var. corymbosa]
MAIMLFLLSLPLLMILISFIHKYYKKNARKIPPGPPGLPFIGNLLQINASKTHESLSELSKIYGPELMSLKFGSVSVVIISSARMAREALTTHDMVFSGRPASAGRRKLSYNRKDIAFSPYSDYWREMRKICVLKLFSQKRVQSFLPVRVDEVSSMMMKISTLSSSSQLVNLRTLIMSFTSNVICRVAFGKRYEEEGHLKRRFDQLLQESQAMIGGFFVSDYIPCLSWMDRVSGMVGRLEKNFNELDLFFRELIDEHLSPNRPDSMKDDLLDLLIQLKHEESSSLCLTWEHIKAILMDIFVAGTDTAAASILWAMTILMKNPETLKKVQAELRDLVGNKRVVDEDDLGELPYLKAVIKETLRLYPPAPILGPRETTQSCTIDGYDIENKSLVLVNAWAIGRDPTYWKNPDDFIPERFINSKVDVKGHDFGLIPFGAGRRGCPGISLGMATVELALANLLCCFDWELPNGITCKDIDMDVMPGLTMYPKSDLSLLAKIYA